MRSTQEVLAAAEEARANLPPAMRIVLATSAFAIVEILVDADRRTAQRLIIVFDDDHDPRIYWVLSALYLQRPDICRNLVGLAESNGRVSYWYQDPSTVEFSRRPLQDACHSALWPQDRWSMEPHTIVPTLSDGTVDRDSLRANDPLRSVAPHRYPLGRVQL